MPCAGLLALAPGLSAEATRPCASALLGIPSMQLLISTRKLRWAGHDVVRMDAERLPRKFFSSWINKDVTRPRGRCMSYGHDLARELRAVGFNLDKR